MSDFDSRYEILLVDDDPNNLRLLSELLTQAGYRARGAIDGSLALRSIQYSSVALVLLDVRMPGLDGFEVCRRIKEQPALAGIPVIFLSAQDAREDRLRGFEAGGVDFIGKPFEPREVLARVRAQLALVELRRELEQARDQLERRVEERTAELRELAAHMEAVREEERASIARELHDEFAGTFTALNLDLGWLEGQLPPSAEALRGKLRDMGEEVRAAARITRRIVTDLRPAVLDDMGLVEAIRWQLEVFSERAGFEFRLNAADEEPVAPRDPRAVTLFRIFQEALSNILRHAQARRVEVACRRDGGELRLEVIDDGVGMERDAAAKPGCHGIRGMRERVYALDGSMVIESPLRGGSRLEVCIPLNDEALR